VRMPAHGSGQKQGQHQPTGDKGIYESTHTLGRVRF
jgi:hypothetical protein